MAGVRTPMPIQEMADKFPEAFKQFEQVCQTLENHYRDMQDMEFTVENGKLYMLQTRNGKRTAAAALKIACDLVDEGMISEQEAVAMIDPRNLDTLLHPQFDPTALKAATPVGTALPASPGAACGKIVFTADDAKEWAARGEKVVLVRLETSPEDIEGMVASQGILTVRGGMTSHAAVVARGMGTCCVSGCGAIKMDEGPFCAFALNRLLQVNLNPIGFQFIQHSDFIFCHCDRPFQYLRILPHSCPSDLKLLKVYSFFITVISGLDTFKDQHDTFRPKLIVLVGCSSLLFCKTENSIPGGTASERISLIISFPLLQYQSPQSFPRYTSQSTRWPPGRESDGYQF